MLQQLCAVSWVPELSHSLQPHHRHPGAGEIPKLEGSGCLGMGRIVLLTVAGTESAADSFVGLGLLQGFECVLGKRQQGGRVWAEGVKEHFLVD